MKKLKTVIMVISLICIAALSAVIVFEKSETNKKDEEIRLMKIVSVERNGKVLQNGAINVRETAGTVMDYYKRMDGSSGSGSYNKCIENMENAYSAMKRTQTEMEEEIRILFPYGFNGDNEYEKNLEVYIRKVKVYSNLAERQYETVKGFS